MSKSKWDERSEANLLPLSVSTDFETALKEWKYAGNTRSTGELNCELCGKKHLHYQFQISNEQTENTLWVGSSCINKFDIYVADEKGVEVTINKDAYLKKHFKHLYVVNLLEKLLDTKPEGKVGNYPKKSLDVTCGHSYLQYQKLNPRELNYVFMRLEEEKISFEKKYFSIAETSYNTEEILKMKELQFWRIAPALTKAQREQYIDNLHKKSN